jgi:hypothetical protein
MDSGGGDAGRAQCGRGSATLPATSRERQGHGAEGDGSAEQTPADFPQLLALSQSALQAEDYTALFDLGFDLREFLLGLQAEELRDLLDGLEPDALAVVARVIRMEPLPRGPAAAWTPIWTEFESVPNGLRDYYLACAGGQRGQAGALAALHFFSFVQNCPPSVYEVGIAVLGDPDVSEDVVFSAANQLALVERLDWVDQYHISTLQPVLESGAHPFKTRHGVAGFLGRVWFDPQTTCRLLDSYNGDDVEVGLHLLWTRANDPQNGEPSIAGDEDEVQSVVEALARCYSRLGQGERQRVSTVCAALRPRQLASKALQRLADIEEDARRRQVLDDGAGLLRQEDVPVPEVWERIRENTR